MATRTLGPGQLSIGEPGSERQFAADCSKTTLTPSTESEDPVPLLDGSNMDGEDTDTWNLGGTVYQNFDFDSLEVWCYQNRGKQLPFVFTPANEGGTEWSGILKVRPIAIGGDVKKKNTSDFEFPVIGDPIPTEIV